MSTENSMRFDPPLVTLLTDFGRRDPFAGIMAGVILSRCPSAQVVDLTHEIDPFDIRGASALWQTALPFFPPGSIHVGVVDPGVGGPRRAVLAEVEGRLLLAPDNGLLTYPLAAHPTARLFALTEAAYWLHPVSAGFHGRDIFAAVAGHLAAGVAPEAVGEPLTDPVRFPVPQPSQDRRGRLTGAVLWVDRFGNCTTNLSVADVEAWSSGDRTQIRISAKGRRIGRMAPFFGALAVGEAGGVLGSAGALELVVNQGDCARAFGLRVGSPVLLSRTNRRAVRLPRGGGGDSEL
jgi:S-adenosyl-L-methionine hydrolase (adenosine-forming)